MNNILGEKESSDDAIPQERNDKYEECDNSDFNHFVQEATESSAIQYIKLEPVCQITDRSAEEEQDPLAGIYKTKYSDEQCSVKKKPKEEDVEKIIKEEQIEFTDNNVTLIEPNDKLSVNENCSLSTSGYGEVTLPAAWNLPKNISSVSGNKKYDINSVQNITKRFRENQQSWLKMSSCIEKSNKLKNCNKGLPSLNVIKKDPNSNNIKKYECEVCKKLFSILDKLRSHLRSCHKRNEKFVCLDCNKVFRHYSYLKKHSVVHCKIMEHKCLICEKEFKTSVSLQYHLTTHKSIKDQKCEICQQMYTSSQNLRAHINRVHKKVHKFMCEKCGKLFLLQTELNLHMNAVHTDNKYKCQECSRMYNSPSYLNKHIKWAHKCIKKYKCNECNKDFIQKANIKRHIETVHLRVKKFTCQICHKTFTQLCNMNIHIDGVHKGIKKFLCDDCGKSFLHFLDLKKHVNAVHIRT